MKKEEKEGKVIEYHQVKTTDKTEEKWDNGDTEPPENKIEHSYRNPHISIITLNVKEWIH